jgi:hypothetical protein
VAAATVFILSAGQHEPAQERWVEVNECKYLFASGQAWSRKDGRDFSAAAWAYLEFD